MIDTLDINEEIRKVLSNKIESILKNIDIGTIILERIDEYVNERATSGKLKKGMISHQRIDWNDFTLSADKISNGTIKNFTSNGIDDHASETNLTVLDGQVVVENELISNHLTVVESAEVKTLTVDNLHIEKSLNIKDGSFAEQIKSLIDNRIAQTETDREFDLNGKTLMSNRVALLDSKSLGNSIIESNLRKVGRLTNLNVIGETTLAETLYANNGKLGVNTDEPAGVVTIWDEESELTIRKYKNRTMYVGSSRDSELVLGVAGNTILSVRKDGIESNKVKIGNISITSSLTKPTHRGAPGDLCINCGPEKLWAWRNQGGESWVPMM